MRINFVINGFDRAFHMDTQLDRFDDFCVQMVRAGGVRLEDTFYPLASIFSATMDKIRSDD